MRVLSFWPRKVTDYLWQLQSFSVLHKAAGLSSLSPGLKAGIAPEGARRKAFEALSLGSQLWGSKGLAVLGETAWFHTDCMANFYVEPKVEEAWALLEWGSQKDGQFLFAGRQRKCAGSERHHLGRGFPI